MLASRLRNWRQGAPATKLAVAGWAHSIAGKLDGGSRYLIGAGSGQSEKAEKGPERCVQSVRLLGVKGRSERGGLPRQAPQPHCGLSTERQKARRADSSMQ